MGADTQRERQGLALLPASEKKEEALRLLAEIEKSEAERQVLLESLEQAVEKCRPTVEERRLYRWLPWASVALGLMAAYGGIEASITQEFCASSRGSWSCSHGLNAQFQGIAELLIGLLLLLLPLPANRWRTFGLWTFGLSLLPVFLGGVFAH